MPRAVDPRFPERMRQLRQLRGLSLRELERRAFFGKSYLHELETGTKMPTTEVARRVDDALNAAGELAEMVTDVPGDEQARTWETSELLARVQSSDTSPTTLEALQATTFELCCDYRWRDAGELRGEALRWLREVLRLKRSASLRVHGELLTLAGWLGLLLGCVEYDMGMRTEAEATRTAVASLGTDAGNPEIVAWSWEMAAWFALTQGRFTDTIAAAEAGQAIAGRRSAAVQLIAQEAKGRARIGDVEEVRAALERGRALLGGLPRPDRPEHHFVVDPDKWDFYAMDAYRLAGDDGLAAHHAREVISLGTAPDGTERAPMRMAEARLTLGVTAARSGELEEAVDIGLAAFRAERRSMPSLLIVAGELDVELWRRFPREPQTAEYRAALRAMS